MFYLSSHYDSNRNPSFTKGWKGCQFWSVAVFSAEHEWNEDFSSVLIGVSMGEQKLLPKEKRACKIYNHRQIIKRVLVIYVEHIQHLIKSGFIAIKIKSVI